jgi:phage N-6-adenine-methyltransferase
VSALPLTTGDPLAECEAVIERGLATFVEVGQALARIRDDGLYRAYGTFERYCAERWNLKRQRAYELMEAAETVSALSEISDIAPPAREAHAAQLAPLREEPEQMREAWTETVERHGDQPTAAQVREVVTERTRGQLANQSGGTDAWATPQDFFDVVNAEFNFTLDVCALDSSAKCERYFTPETDGLTQKWTGTCWMNPPYGDEIKHWVRKAHESAQAGATVVCLVPARVDTGWWWEHCRHAEVRFLRGRLKFGDADTSAPFPSALVIFGRPAATVYWEWQA